MKKNKDYNTICKEMYKDYLDVRRFENIGFVDAIKPLFKTTFMYFGQSAITFKLTYDILYKIKNTPKIYSNYTLKEQKMLDNLLKICFNETNFINNTMDDIADCFGF